jgi:hypothetical protein
MGIKEREVGTLITLQDVTSAILPDDVFIAKRSYDSVRFGYHLSMTINGNKTPIEAILTKDGGVNIEYGSSSLPLDKLGVKP